MRDEVAGVEIAGLENDRLEIDGLALEIGILTGHCLRHIYSKLWLKLRQRRQ